MKKRITVKRSIFSELTEGLEAMNAHRKGKVTLRTHSVAPPKWKKAPGAEFFVAAREKFNVSRAVWANMLRVSPRTVEKWELGGQASPLAATFVELVTRYPDTIERLKDLPRRIPRSSNRDGRRVHPGDGSESKRPRNSAGGPAAGKQSCVAFDSSAVDGGATKGSVGRSPRVETGTAGRHHSSAKRRA